MAKKQTYTSFPNKQRSTVKVDKLQVQSFFLLLKNSHSRFFFKTEVLLFSPFSTFFSFSKKIEELAIQMAMAQVS